VGCGPDLGPERQAVRASPAGLGPGTTGAPHRTGFELEAADDSFGQVKASASLRTVVVPKLAAAALEAHLEKFTAKSRAALIFTTSTGGIVYPCRIGRHWARTRAAAGRDDLRWHDLRHTGQSIAEVGGVAADATSDGFCDRLPTCDLGFRPDAAVV